MLLVTFEEIADYFGILQKKDKGLGKRVMRFGSDEESFYKWNETLQTCSFDLGLINRDTGLFDSDRDLQDFNQDMEHLQTNLMSILQNVPGLINSSESVTAAKLKLIEQQQTDRTAYKTKKAVKAEKEFDPKLIRYEKVIGRGGFGEVWQARYRGDYIAIKKVPSSCLSDQAITSLKIEAEFMKKLSHPRIVACFGILEDGGNYCMVMELCVNGSLANFMATNKASSIDFDKRLDFAIDVAIGMNYLQKLGVIHRDLKLGNVVLDKHDRAKITDFGLSVVKTATQTSMKLDECGTPQYMAPESFGLVPIFSTKSDVYAFSIILWELSHWKAAYLNVSVAEIKDAIKDGDRLPVDGSVPSEIKRLINDCWADNPRFRPTFAAIIDRFLKPPGNTVGISSTIHSFMQLATWKKPVAKSSNRITSSKKITLIRKKSYILAGLALLFLLLIAGGIGIYVYLTSIKSIAPASIPTESAAATQTISQSQFPAATVSTLIQNTNLLNGVYGMTIDEDDNLYVGTATAVAAYPLILKITTGLNPTLTLIANLSSDGQGITSDQGICYFNRSLYVPRIGQLTRIDLDNGNLVSRFAGKGIKGTTTDGQNSSAIFNGAIHCVCDKSGNIYVGESSRIIRKVNQTGFVKTLVSLAVGQLHSFVFNGTDRIVFPTSGLLNAGDGLINNLNLLSTEVTTLAGNTSHPADTEGPSFQISMTHPIGVTFDKAGNLYFSKNYGVWKLNRTNYVSLFVGSTSYGLVDGSGADSRFSNPRHIITDSKDRIFLADQGNNAIRLIKW